MKLRPTQYIWNQVPLFRVLWSLIPGIIVGIFYPNPDLIPYLVCVLGILVIVFISSKNARKRGFIWLIFGFLLFGYTTTVLQNDLISGDHFSNNIPEERSNVLLRVNSDPIAKTNSLKLEAEVLAFIDDTRVYETQGTLLVYLQKCKNAETIRYGDTLLINSYLNEVPEPRNPEEFNYKRYLGFHQISHQVYADSLSFSTLNTGKGVKRFVFQVQRSAIESLRDAGFQDRELAIVSALLVGYKHYLSPDQVSAFASAGAMHVLAVSGLHVGMVYIMLMLLFKPISHTKNGRTISSLFILLVLWFYAAVTGFSPSVTRACTMFSAVVFAKLINRDTHIFNTLAVSAFLLLIYNPYYLVEVGFQLSYVAVIGIVLIQPRIEELWHPSSYLLKKIWSITAVSLAAQIATFPLGLLYFHQFPNYFLISNLVVIPAATLILPLGIVFLLISFIPYISTMLAFILYWTVHLLDQFISIIEQLPFSILYGIDISILETYLIYSMVVGISMILIKKSFYWQRFFLISLCILALVETYEYYHQTRQQELIVYSVNNQTAIASIQGYELNIYGDSSLISDGDKMQFHVKHSWWKRGLKEPTETRFSNELAFELFRANNKVICLLKGEVIINNPLPEVDILMIDSKTPQSLSELARYCTNATILLGNRLKWRERTEILEECERQGIVCHDLKNRAFALVD